MQWNDDEDVNFDDEPLPTKEQLLMALQTATIPYIRSHGGNFSVDDISSDGIVSVSMSGTCENCSAQELTLKANVERTLRRIFPKVSKVVLTQQS